MASPQGDPMPTGSAARIPLVRFSVLAILLVSNLSVGGAMAANTSCPAGMVAWWKAEGNAADSAGTNHGIVVNSVGFPSGAVGAAFDFDASYVRVPHAPSLNFAGSFTLEAWINPQQDGLYQIVGKWGHPAGRMYSFHTMPGAGLRFAVSDDAHQGDGGFHAFDVFGVLHLNQWNHVAAVYEQPAGRRMMFVNGAQVASRIDPPISLTSSEADLGIGAILFEPNVVDLHFPGQIDEVAIYDRPLTNAEILAIFEAGSLGKCQQVSACSAGMVGWWPGNGDANDDVGTNDGVLVNGATFGTGPVGSAFSFDGVNDYVNLFSQASSFFENSDPFTLEAWFRAESESASYFILRNAAFGVKWQGTSSPLLFYNGNNHYSSKTSWEIGRWYHVALVDDGADSVKFYIDGNLDKSEEGALRNPSRFPCHAAGYCFELQFGGYYETHDVMYFKGQVDEVTIYNRALPAVEIQAIYDARSAGKCLRDDDGDGHSPPDDCEDSDPLRFPGALETPDDGIDQDCNGTDTVACWLDEDGDAFGTITSVLAADGSCDVAQQESLVNTDCHDGDASIFPGGREVYDHIDNNCDGVTDEGLDADGDGVPDFYDACPGTPPGSGVAPDGCPACMIDVDSDLDGYPLSADCNDREAAIHPGAVETCNRIDDDCDTALDEGFDRDGDGYSTCAVPVADCNDFAAAVKPGTTELPGNTVDENCDGSLGACDPNAVWTNHGEFVRCVADECEQLIAAGALTDLQCDILVGQAGKSDVGKQVTTRQRSSFTSNQ
jgi:hypothetical protein